MSLPLSKHPKCKSYEFVKGAIKDPFHSCKSDILWFHCWFPKALSNHLPVIKAIPFLYDDLQSSYKKLIELTISQVPGKCEDRCKELLKIDLPDGKNHEKGYACWFWRTARLKKDCATHNNINKFRIDAREFIVTLLEKMYDKNPISFDIVK